MGKIIPITSWIKVRDECTGPFHYLEGETYHTKGTQANLTTFYLSEKLTSLITLGCDICDGLIEEILPRRICVGLDNKITVPILRNF